MRSRRAVQILLTLLGGYVLLALLVAMVQRQLIYIPTKLSADAALEVARMEEFTAWRRSNGEIAGWQFRPNPNATGSVLIVHGNAGSALNRSYLAEPVRAAANVNVFVLEYPGYGARGGKPGLDSFLRAGEEAFDLLPTNAPVYLVAESLGAGVAAHLAKTRASRVKGLVCFAPYDDLAAVGQRQMPFLPVKLLLRDRFQPAEWLRGYAGPLKVVVAENDTIIPAEFGRRLHDGYRGPKTIETIRGAGHNDIAGQSAVWWKNVFSFWNENPPPE